MKNTDLVFVIFIVAAIQFAGCSDTPSGSLRDEQFGLIRQNVKSILGEDYDAVNFVTVSEGYQSEEKTEYDIKFTFDLNKRYLIFDGKRIPGELTFKKNDQQKWECTFNSGNATGLFNLLNLNSK